MWHEVALTGMVAICVRSKVDTPASLRRSGRPIFGRIRVDITSLRAEMGDAAASWGLDELRSALAQALVSTGRTGFQ
jgi:hypothetical protein